MVNVAAIIGNITAFIYRANSVQAYSPLVYVLTFMNCLLGLFYGFLLQPKGMPLIIVNSVGIVMAVIYLGIFITYYSVPMRVNLVVNFDLPMKYGTREPDCEVYLHRIGRAGRFGRKGAVFNLLCTEMDHTLMAKIENHFATPIVEVAPWNSEVS